MLTSVASRADSEWGRAIGAAISRMLDARGISRRQLAGQLGVDPTTVGRILSGRSPLDVDQLDRIAGILSVSPRTLLAEAGYIDDAGLIDPDQLPPGAARAIRAILREFRVGDDGPNDADDI